MIPQVSLLATVQGRQQLVDGAMNFTRNTALAPKEYEQQLLVKFVQGELTIDQVLILLEAHESE